MSPQKTAKNKFQPIFDYMDERFAKIEADISFMRERLDLCITNAEKCERRWEIYNRRWELNDRRFNRHMEMLENQNKRIINMERKIS
jgi:hypothetical protein